jgi:pimeloyl-ACP methyl ester carboxylesterase
VSAPDRGQLITWTSGLSSGPTVLLLHDRYGDHDHLDALGAAFAQTHRVVAVRSARTQMEDTGIKGYYWFLGAHERPELSTLGDGLYHLEKLLLAMTKDAPVTLVGVREGGTMALTLALVWPDLISGVASLGGVVPTSLDSLPVSLQPLDGLPILLADNGTDLATTVITLIERGGEVERRTQASEADVASWANGLPRH